MGNQTRIKENKMKKILGIVMGLGLACVANADIIAGYDFGDGTATTAVTTEATGVTATDVTASGADWETLTVIGDNTGEAASGTTFGSTAGGALSTLSTGLRTTSWDAAMTASDYASFSVNTDSTDDRLNLSGLSVDTSIAGVNAAESFQIWYLADATGSEDADYWIANATALTLDDDSTYVSTGTQSLGEWDSLFVDLSGITALQDVDSAEFRIVYRGGSSQSASSRTNIDNLVLEGTVIPEPATIGLLGLGTAALLVFRRRMA
jgi:hypothetical protein